MSTCERCKGTGWAHEYFTSGPHSCGVRYVACGCGTRGAVIANEYTKASAAEGVTEAMVEAAAISIYDDRYESEAAWLTDSEDARQSYRMIARAALTAALAASGDSALGAGGGGAA